MPTYETILFEPGTIARITLNRPDRLNSFTVQMHEELRDALGKLGEARVVVLTGAGRGFCAGQDLNDRAVAPGEKVDLGETVTECWNPLVRTLTSLPQPVIARVNGVAAGAGANIALACDMVVAAKSAKFIQSFSAIGLIPDSGGTWALPRLVGQARALGLALTGEPLPAEKAAEWGLIWKAVDDEALDDEVDAIASTLASLPPLGLAAIKDMIRSSWQYSLDEELERQAEQARRENDDLLERVLQVAQVHAQPRGLMAGERVEGVALKPLVSDRFDTRDEAEQGRERDAFESDDQARAGALHARERREEMDEREPQSEADRHRKRDRAHSASPLHTPVDVGHAHLPVNFGARFSRKAATPSR
jgi:2-(1,2-epoxy-1,2-dihydrophenyl)acetyl-CoA isomerase